MQGLFIENRRPKSKKEVKEVAAANPQRISVETTSWYNDEYGGSLTELKPGQKIYFVGPDPHKDRRFYGSIENKNGVFIVK